MNFLTRPLPISGLGMALAVVHYVLTAVLLVALTRAAPGTGAEATWAILADGLFRVMHPLVSVAEAFGLMGVWVMFLINAESLVWGFGAAWAIGRLRRTLARPTSDEV